MKSWNKAGKAWLAAAAALLITAGASPSWATNTSGEVGCFATMTKSLGKHVSAVAKAMATCDNGVLAGTVTGPCPDATAQAAIDKSTSTLLKTVPKKCQSACSVSAVSCIDSDTCPPNGALRENCTAAGKNFFEASNMGFPGPYCPGILGRNLQTPEDFGTCMSGVGSLVSDEILRNTYGSLVTAPSAASAACLAAIIKNAPSAAAKIASAVAKCRNTQLASPAPAFLPSDCPTSDAKVASAISSSLQKFKDGIAGACTDPAVGPLDLCGAGIGGITTGTAAQDCLTQMLVEISYSTDNAEDRPYAGISLINASYPSTAAARCGDNVANQTPNQFLSLGEECDGTDDSACPGNCLPPGDIFECTCSNIRRSHSFAYGFEADLDNGWAGSSHNSKVTDGAGFVSTVTNCDCDQFDPTEKATCLAGHSTDPVCDITARLAPRCSQRPNDTGTCDQFGNNNGANTSADCKACDAFAGNAGDYCTGAARYCLGGANTGDRCNTPSDCPAGTCTGIGQCIDGPFAGNGCAGPQNCGVCAGGASVGQACSTNGNCPGSTCTAHTCATKSCMGGANEGNICNVAGDCPGGRCAETSDCSAQCYDAEGVPTGACASQADCAEGERCQGACDSSNTCVILRNGAPLPLSAEGTSVCIDSQFFTDMVGSRNMYDGSHEINYELRSITILSNEVQSRPCPVCGGWCADSNPAQALDRSRCEGSCVDAPERECRVGPNQGESCTTNGDCSGYLCTYQPCRFDDDCSTGTCNGDSSPECAGRECRIDNACGGGPNHGKACRIEAASSFGTTSADCPADPATNVSGAGLAISWTPMTSAQVTLEEPGACDAQGYQNYDCNCVRGGGSTRNQPNRCNAACNAPGPNFGRECSAFTSCVGGSENGAACDEDSDCSGGGTCSGNPRVCGDGSTGACSVARCAGGTNNGNTCAQAGQCPGGTCDAPACTVGGTACAEGSCIPDDCTTAGDCDGGATCDDACPAGRCTPLCVDRGHCVGGDKDGLFCALDGDCTGGGTCVPQASDEDEGACAQGDFNHCDGPGWGFVSCAPLQVGTQQGCETGTDSILGNSNDNIGAGYCRADITQCFTDNGSAEGGTTANGKGDPTNSYSVAAFCIPASTNGAVNTTAGLPGPGRIRQRSLNVPNYPELP